MSYLQHEVKFVLPAFRVDLVRSYLGQMCRRDPAYPAGRVSTIYFDSRELSSLEEKRNSDYLKTKIRIRWYEDSSDSEPFSPAFVEIKRRRGSRREKLRVEVAGGTARAEALSRAPLDSPELSSVVREVLTKEGLFVPALRPTLFLRYRRERFSDPLVGARISLDSQITAIGRHPLLARLPAPALLRSAVVEFKSVCTELPPSLAHLTKLGCRRSSFSKYDACYEAAA